MAKTIDEYGVATDQATVHMEKLLPASVDVVWEYLTESDKRATWLASGVMGLYVGGPAELCFNFKNLTTEATPERFLPYESNHRQQGYVTLCEPPHLLSFTWNERDGRSSEVRFELRAQGDLTLLILTHSRLPNRNEMVSVASGWHTHLGILEDRLNRQQPRQFWATHARLEAEYQQRIPAAS